jgi:hypothetical protein
VPITWTESQCLLGDSEPGVIEDEAIEDAKGQKSEKGEI